jgi:hypothetical protein
MVFPPKRSAVDDDKDRLTVRTTTPRAQLTLGTDFESSFEQSRGLKPLAHQRPQLAH